MKEFLRIGLLLLAALFVTTGCQEDEGESTDALPFSPYVDAFTTGKVSRTTPVYLILNQDVAGEKMTPAVLSKAMKIKPEVKGDFEFDNAHTIVFRPTGEFERDKQYSISADLSQLFEDVSDTDKNFTFKFSTLPISLRGNLESMSVNTANESTYDFVVNLYTADSETPETVESLVKISENGTLSWVHSDDGKKHILKIEGVAGGKKVKTMEVSVGANKIGAAKGEILSVYVPSSEEFGVYDIRYVTEPERYVEVVFSKTLDPSQNLEGLAQITDNRSATVTKDGNKVRLYPDAGRKGSITVQLDASIKSKGGATLGEYITREIELSSEAPAVKFIGEGVVVPQSTQILVPFRAVYLRGVVVRVIRVMEHNMGQFLQENRLDGTSELIRVGRLVARKTIFFDEQENDLTQWGTYAVDLKQLMEPEPGAIYRVELSYNRDLSAYPCGDDSGQKSREQLLAEDEVKFRDELNRFDQGGYYYYYNDFDWDYYDYSERNDPCSYSFYNNTTTGRNVLATNLGVIAKAGAAGEMLVQVHDLLSTNPVQGVEVTAYNYQNQELGKGATSDKGEVRLELLNAGVPYYVIATSGKQRSYVRVDNGSALSLSTFDVSGEVVQKGLKGFIYGERGVWRPGDNIHLGFMLNDRAGTIPGDHPVVMELYNPLGQLHSKKTQTRGAMGIYAFTFNTDQDAPTGAWNVKVQVGGVTFSKRIRIEAIKPNRLKIDLNFDNSVLERGEPTKADFHTEWLTGAKARGLSYEIEVSFATASTAFPKFGEFIFEDRTKSFESDESRFASGKVNDQGDARVEGRLGAGDTAPGMLTANFTTRVYEESGDFSIDVLRVPYSPYSSYVGILSPQKTKEHLNTGSKQSFQVASVDSKGNGVGNSRVTVEVYKIRWHWWWNAEYDRIANYISDRYNDPVTSMEVTTNSSGKGSFDLNFSNNEWGTYYIKVRDRSSGHTAGVMCYFDWPGWAGNRGIDGGDAAMVLNFKLDKDTYKPGDKITLTVPSSEGSRAIVSVENGSRVISTSQHVCEGGESKIQIEATADMMPNAYIYVTLLQPHGATLNDLPIRLYGVQPVTVTSPQSYLTPVLKAPDEIQPENKYEVTVSEKDGREMAYTIAIVDEGLLDLTRFKTPDPWSAFNAREALGVNTWDMYNYVVGAYGGRIEQLFSIGGDDEAAGGPKAIVNRFKPVVQFEGPFMLKKGGRQKHTFEMPNYNGRVRVMVVAGDGKAYGNTEKSVMVRKPVMLIGTLPRVIGVGEEMLVPATVFTTIPNIGSVKVSIATSANMQVVGSATQELSFTEATDKSAYFRIKVGSGAGAGKVTLTATSKGDKSTYETDIEIRSVRRPQTRVVAATVDAGAGWNQTVSMPGLEGTNKLTLEVSDVEPLNLSARLDFLIGYPHGCIEQITSKGFPQLYLKQFASLTKAQEDLMEASVKDVISRQRSYQTAEGGFSYWPGGTSTHAWGSIYGTHFQIEAEGKGYNVPAQMKNAVLSNLGLIARNWKPASGSYMRSEELTQAYRLYVLALAKQPELGAMNRLKENTSISPMTRWMLAAAYATAGRTDVAKSVVEQTVDMGEYVYNEYDYTFGSNLRDKAIRLIALVLMDQSSQAAVLANEISKELASDSWMSTQTTGFALVAMSQYMNRYKVAESMQFSYAVAGKGDKVKSDRNVWSETLLEKGGTSAVVDVKNTGKSTLFLRVITEGTPAQGEEEAYANGLTLSVKYQDTNGSPVDIAKLEQGTNFQAVVTVRNPTSTGYNNIVLTQIFPAGWEILNTRYMNEGGSDSYPSGVNYQDIRDDRVYSYMDKLPSGREVTVRINLAAIYAGTFYCPPVWCEAMYDNQVRANTEGRNVEVIR